MSHADHTGWLHRELDDWTRDGLIDTGQASAIRKRYPAGDSATGGRLVTVIAIIGAVLCGLGIILFVGANWDGISHLERLVLLITTMVALYAAGWRLRAGGRHDGIATALLLVATMTFGASVFLIGQTYHVRAHDPLGFLVWASAAAAMALVLGSRAQGALACMALAAWWAHDTALRFALEGDDDSIAAIVVVAAFGPLVLLAAGRAARALVDAGHYRWLEPLAGPAWATGLTGAAAVLLVPLSFAHHLDGDDQGVGGNALGYVLSLALPLALVLATSLVAARVSQLTRAREEAIGIAALATALFTIGFLTNELAASVIANAAVVLIAVGCILLGILRGHTGLYAAGVAVAVSEIALRYLDVALASEQLSGSVAFLGGGVLLLAIAWGVSRARAAWVERAGAA